MRYLFSFITVMLLFAPQAHGAAQIGAAFATYSCATGAACSGSTTNAGRQSTNTMNIGGGGGVTVTIAKSPKPTITISGPYSTMGAPVGGSYASALVTAINQAAGKPVMIPAGTYSMAGIEALSSTITQDINIVGAGTVILTAVGEKFLIPNGKSVTMKGLTFSDFLYPVYLRYAHPLVHIEGCNFTGANRTVYGHPWSLNETDIVTRLELINNTLTNVSNGFDIKAKIGSALVTGNNIKGVSYPSWTYGINIGDHDNSDDVPPVGGVIPGSLDTYQDESGNYIITNNYVEDVHSSTTDTSDNGPTTNGIVATGNTVVISGNTVRNMHSPNLNDCEGIYTKAYNITISGNTLVDTAQHSAQIIAKGWNRTDTRAPRAHMNVIANNTILSTTTDADRNWYGIQTYGSTEYNISHNIISGATAGGMALLGDADPSRPSENILIDGNIIRNTLGDTAILSYAVNTRRMKIVNNIVDGVKGSNTYNIGIKVRDTGAIATLDISGNQINMVSLAANTNQSPIAIMVQPSLNSSDVSIKDNQIKTTHDTLTSVGIAVNNASGSIISGLVIANNKINTTDGKQILFNSSSSPDATYFPLAYVSNNLKADNSVISAGSGASTIGVGTAPDSTVSVRVVQSQTQTTGFPSAFYSTVNVQPTTASTAAHSGVKQDLNANLTNTASSIISQITTASKVTTGGTLDVGNGVTTQLNANNLATNISQYYSLSSSLIGFSSGTLGTYYGLFQEINVDGGTISNAYGARLRLNFNTGSVPSYRGLWVNKAGAGVPGTSYGLYLDDLAGSTAWGVYQVGVNTKNHFDGVIDAKGGSANHAICWKADGKTLGYCSVVVAADGTCGTCN